MTTMTNKMASPCRHCGKPTEDHCDSRGCHWWLCPACKSYGSDRSRRYVHPMGKKPLRGEDGKVREAFAYESHKYQSDG